MSPRSVEPTGAARAAILGAATDVGGRVRLALERRRVPGARVDLFGATEGEAVLGEYAGEARLIQDPDPSEVSGHQVLFVCESGEHTDRLLADPPDALIVDLVHGTGGPGAPVLVVPGSEEPPPPGTRYVAVPQPLAIVLHDLLDGPQARYGVRAATGFVVRPAADFGEAGIEELREQTVRLLNFASLPRDVFEAQLAFNVIPQRRLPGGAGEEARLASETARLMSWPEPRLALRLVAASVFHGHAVCLRLELERPASVDGVREALTEAERVTFHATGEADTPLEAVGGPSIAVGEVAEDGLGGFWISSVAAEAGTVAAEEAVRLARSWAGL